MLLDSRELLERRRRERLHARIGALQAKIESLGQPVDRYTWLKRRKLELLVAELEGRLQQAVIWYE